MAQPSLFPGGIPQDNVPQSTCADCDDRMKVLDRLAARVKRLQTLLKYWEKRAKTREAELARLEQVKLDDADHPLCRKYAEACKTIDDLRDLAHKLWEDKFALGVAQKDAPDDQALKRLIGLAHPDKWAPGQSAATLAHEMMVALNRLRERR
jgi:hypothetical protein